MRLRQILYRLAMGRAFHHGEHVYVSTYCIHGNHAVCRWTCKMCNGPCVCICHYPSRGSQ